MADEDARKERARLKFMEDRAALLKRAQKRLEEEEEEDEKVDEAPQWSTNKGP
jgi:phage gpG-like protein